MLPQIPERPLPTHEQDDSGFLDFRSKEEMPAACAAVDEVRASPVGANRKTSLSANFWVGMDDLVAPAANAAAAAPVPLRKTSRNHDEQPIVGSYLADAAAAAAAASDGCGKASRSKRHSAPPGSLDNLSFENFGKKQRPSQST